MKDNPTTFSRQPLAFNSPSGSSPDSLDKHAIINKGVSQPAVFEFFFLIVSVVMMSILILMARSRHHSYFNSHGLQFNKNIFVKKIFQKTNLWEKRKRIRKSFHIWPKKGKYKFIQM
jgi:hypothetical protein